VSRRETLSLSKGEAAGLQLELRKLFNDESEEAKLLAWQLETLEVYLIDNGQI